MLKYANLFLFENVEEYSELLSRSKLSLSFPPRITNLSKLEFFDINALCEFGLMLKFGVWKNLFYEVFITLPKVLEKGPPTPPPLDY